MTVLVDSNILLDVLTEDAEWSERSSAALAEAGDRSRLVINPIIFAAVSIGFSRIEDLDDVLPHTVFDREPLPHEAAFLAGKAYLAYRRRGGERRSSLTDFLIGAHAAVSDYELITRDAARYRTYFPRLRLIAPL
jgi:hypothetical protein